MKLISAALAALVLAAAPAVVQAQDRPYQYIAKLPNGEQTAFIDLRSVERQGTMVTYWTLWVFTPATDLDGAQLVWARRQYRDDCVRRNSTQLDVRLGLENGERSPYDGPPDDMAPVPWVDGPEGSGIGNFVCGTGPAPGTARYNLNEAVRAAQTNTQR